jgi:hypothetical protein
MMRLSSCGESLCFLFSPFSLQWPFSVVVDRLAVVASSASPVNKIWIHPFGVSMVRDSIAHILLHHAMMACEGSTRSNKECT